MKVIKESRDIAIPDSDMVTVTVMNHHVEIQHLEKANKKATIKKLDAENYIVHSTGEIKQFEHQYNRQQSLHSLRITLKRLRYLINNNFTGSPNELFLTLTYKDNMTSTKRLYKDFEKFIKRLRYEFRNQTTIDYLSVVEPQARGAWHCHVLVKFNSLDYAYLDNAFLRSLWGLGFVKIKSLKEVDNIGAYLSAYLADVELNKDNLALTRKEGTSLIEKSVDGEEKTYIKGGRLHMYPAGMNLYRCSKGIVIPERVEMRFSEIKKIVGFAEPNYQRSITIHEGEFANTIQYQQYNIKRKHTQVT